MKFFDLSHPWLRPLWVRIGVTAVCLGWGIFEFFTGEVFWSVLFTAAAAWCAYSFFYAPDAGHRSQEDDND